MFVAVRNWAWVGFCFVGGCAAVVSPTATEKLGPGDVTEVVQYYSRPNDDPWETLTNCEALKADHGYERECSPYETAIIGVHGRLENQMLHLSYGALLWTWDRVSERQSRWFGLRAWSLATYDAKVKQGSFDPRSSLAPFAEMGLQLRKKAGKMAEGWPLNFATVDLGAPTQPLAWATLDLPAGVDNEGVIEVVAPTGRAMVNGVLGRGEEVQQLIRWSVEGEALTLELESLVTEGYYQASYEEVLGEYAKVLASGNEQARAYVEYMRAHGVSSLHVHSPTVCVAGDCPDGTPANRYPMRVLKDRAMVQNRLELRDRAVKYWWAQQNQDH